MGSHFLDSRLVNANIGVDLTVRAGADPQGRARLHAPFPASSGSSVSHFDTVAFKNLLMEPAIDPDLTHQLTAPDDLTLELLRDVGWFADADLDRIADEKDCRVQSNFSPTIVIGGENTCRERPVQHRMYDLRPDRQHSGRRKEPWSVREWRGTPDERVA